MLDWMKRVIDKVKGGEDVSKSDIDEVTKQIKEAEDEMSSSLEDLYKDLHIDITSKPTVTSTWSKPVSVSGVTVSVPTWSGTSMASSGTSPSGMSISTTGTVSAGSPIWSTTTGTASTGTSGYYAGGKSPSTKSYPYPTLRDKCNETETGTLKVIQGDGRTIEIGLDDAVVIFTGKKGKSETILGRDTSVKKVIGARDSIVIGKDNINLKNNKAVINGNNISIDSDDYLDKIL